MKNYTANRPYTLAIPETLFEEWGWFENRGYLPPLPGEVWQEAAEGGSLGIEPYRLCLLSEAEAWDFGEAWIALGEAAGACVADVQSILDFLEEIV